MAFKIPTPHLGHIEFELPNGTIKVLDAYDAWFQYAILVEKVSEERAKEGKILTENEAVRQWAANLFDMKYEDWCPMSAGFVLDKVKETITSDKKKERATSGRKKPSSTESTASQTDAPEHSASIG